MKRTKIPFDPVIDKAAKAELDPSVAEECARSGVRPEEIILPEEWGADVGPVVGKDPDFQRRCLESQAYFTACRLDARKGKIARLPHGLREELNGRLLDGEPGPAILKWLHEQPAARQVLKQYFEGKPVTEQNLTHWRHGGFLDWERRQLALSRTQDLVEEAEELAQVGRGRRLSERVAVLLEAELGERAREVFHDWKGSLIERDKKLVDLAKELDRLRRTNQRQALLELQQEKREWERADRQKALEREARQANQNQNQPQDKNQAQRQLELKQTVAEEEAEEKDGMNAPLPEGALQALFGEEIGGKFERLQRQAEAHLAALRKQKQEREQVDQKPKATPGTQAHAGTNQKTPGATECSHVQSSAVKCSENALEWRELKANPTKSNLDAQGIGDEGVAKVKSGVSGRGEGE